MQLQFARTNAEHLAQPLTERWNELLTERSNVYKMYNSPSWWQHLLLCDRHATHELVLVTDSTNEIVGIVPLRTAKQDLGISIGRRGFNVSSIKCLEVLGSQLLLPASSDCYRQFFRWIWFNYPDIDGVYFKSVTNDSFEWKFMDDACWNIDGSLVYKSHASRILHKLTLAGSFEDYLSTHFRNKKRYNLKRQVRVLGGVAESGASIQCIVDAGDVPLFNSHVKAIAGRSWKARGTPGAMPGFAEDDDVLADVASRGLLRAYLLFLDGVPITYVLGYQFHDIYHYADIGFDAVYGKYSPGCVLLYRIIEDLAHNTEVRLINFGIGDSEYKRQFANDSVSDNSMFVLRNSMRNRLQFVVNEIVKGAKERLRPIGTSVLKQLKPIG